MTHIINEVDRPITDITRLNTPDKNLLEKVITDFLQETAYLIKHPSARMLADILVRNGVEIAFQSLGINNQEILPPNVTHSESTSNAQTQLILESLQKTLSWEVLPSEPVLRLIKDHNLLSDKPLLRAQKVDLPYWIFGDLYPSFTGTSKEHSWNQVFSEQGKAKIRETLRSDETTRLIFTLSSTKEIDNLALLVAVDLEGLIFIADRGKVTVPVHIPLKQANHDTLEQQISEIVRFYQRMTPLEELGSRAKEGRLTPEIFSQRREQLSQRVAYSVKDQPETQQTIESVKAMVTNYLSLINTELLEDRGRLTDWQQNSYPPHLHYLSPHNEKLVKSSLMATCLEVPDAEQLVVYIPVTSNIATNYGPGKVFQPKYQFIYDNNRSSLLHAFTSEKPKWVRLKPKQPYCVVVTCDPREKKYPCCPSQPRRGIKLSIPEEQFRFELMSTLIEQAYTILYDHA